MSFPESKILIAGSGGQGILLLGKVLAHSLLSEGRNVSWLPSYGAEVRGGTCKCMVTASDDEIASPYIFKPDYLIVMNEPSYLKYSPLLDFRGLVFYNQTLIGKEVLNPALKNMPFPATDIALEIGDIRIANMVILGFFIKQSHIVQAETVKKILPDFIKNRKILELDRAALEKGLSN